jgi:hypothetical protein
MTPCPQKVMLGLHHKEEIQYEIFNKETGFLVPSPLQRLGPVFEPWEQIIDNLQSLILSGKLRSAVSKVFIFESQIILF